MRKRLESASSSQITSVPSQETGERPSFMQEVSSPERSTFVQFTYSDLCQKFYSAATASNLSHIVLGSCHFFQQAGKIQRTVYFEIRPDPLSKHSEKKYRIFWDFFPTWGGGLPNSQNPKPKKKCL